MSGLRKVLTQALAEEWQLAAGHFIPAKMTPNIIHPRPDSETNAFARCRRAPSSIEWRCPIVVQGGAWPFKYQIITGPSGATLTETLPSDWLTNGLQNYGVITWTTPTVGSHSFTVRVTDQDGTIVERSWTLTVSDRENSSLFMFIDPAGSNSNSGAYSSRKANLAGWWGSSKADSAHDNKQIFYFSGTYSVTAIPIFGGSGQQVDLISTKPQIHIAIPGDTVTFANNNQAYWDVESSDDDLYFEGMSWTGPTVLENGVNRKTHIRAGANPDRSVFFRVRFVGNTDMSVSGTNSACYMFGGNPDPANYFSIIQCTFDACNEQDFGLHYDTRDVVCEGNAVANGYMRTGSDHAGGFFLKANNIQRVTVRANRALGTINTPLLYFSQFVDNASDTRSDIEFCWNNVRNDSTIVTSEGAGGVGIGQGGGSTGNNYGRFWSYRNNMRNPHIGLVGIGMDTPMPGPFVFQNDVIQHSGTHTDGFFMLSSSALPGQLTKTNLATGTSMVDSTTNLLAGSARTTYLGTHGCEVQ